MAKVGFTHKDETGRFQTQDGAGAEVLVEGGKTYKTDDPHVIAELDASEFVKRVGSSKRREKPAEGNPEPEESEE